MPLTSKNVLTRLLLNKGFSELVHQSFEGVTLRLVLTKTAVQIHTLTVTCSSSLPAHLYTCMDGHSVESGLTVKCTDSHMQWSQVSPRSRGLQWSINILHTSVPTMSLGILFKCKGKTLSNKITKPLGITRMNS